ncbi:MAG: YraN family protein [Flavobacteriales bacterium]|nr:YraN family protein [Flavobacteriales bacterium]
MSNSAKHIKTGNQGEDFAYQYLIHHGHQILETNWRYEKGEIDLISIYDSFLVITEVKTRTTNKYGEPHEDVGEKKQEKLIDTAVAYCEQKEIDLELRFDIISIVLEPKVLIEHIVDAF